MSAEMVRAILDGRKTQTRRVVKPQPRHGVYGDGRLIRDDYFVWDAPGDKFPTPMTDGCIEKMFARCPYGEPGDRLWVRETWAFARGGLACQLYCANFADSETLAYKADGPAVADDFKWRPSIHMPRIASRITLELTAVRVERLQAISHKDALAEGIDASKPVPMRGRSLSIAQMMYADLWDRLNAKMGLGWEANPWVWVLEFERIKRAWNHET